MGGITHSPTNRITPSSGATLPNSAAPPAARRVAKQCASSHDITPKGSSRASAKRLALDVLDTSDEALSSTTLVDILSLVRKLVDDNSVLKRELADVKVLLQSIIGSPSSIGVNPTSQAATLSYATVTKAKKVVVINPASDKINAETSRQIIKSKLNPVNYKLNGVSSTKKGGVVVQCQSSAELNKFKQDAESQLGADFVVTAPVGKRPRVRVFGFSDQYNAIDLVTVLKDQNDSVFTEASHISVIHLFNGKSNSRFGAKLEVDASTFKRLMDVGKVYIGWDSCGVTEDLNIRRCYKCWGFNHLSSKCTETEQRCPKCTGNHHQNVCNSAEEKCAVCCDAVSKYNVKIQTNHTVFSSDCPSYIHHIALQHRKIDYSK